MERVEYRRVSIYTLIIVIRFTLPPLIFHVPELLFNDSAVQINNVIICCTVCLQMVEKHEFFRAEGNEKLVSSLLRIYEAVRITGNDRSRK